jgi:predicted PurR-regulated permease PerM
MIPTYSLQNKAFFYSIMVCMAALILWLVNSYLDVIVFSLVMVIILKPVYNFFERRLKGRAGFAATLTLITMFVAILIPLWFTLRLIDNQLTDMVQTYLTPQGAGQVTMQEFQAKLNTYLEEIPGGERFRLTDEQMANLRQGVVDGAVWLGGILVNLGMSVPSIIARLFIFFSIVGGLLPNYHRFVATLMALSPLDDAVDRIYLRRIKAMTWSMFIGIVVIAMAQGLITGLFFWITGVPYAALWTLIAIVTSALPLGASLVALPVATVQILMGDLTGGLIVLGGYILVVTNIDNVIRPRLVSREAYLDAALVLIAALGGYDLFGFFGVIYGPVLMILAMTTLEVYRTYYAPRQKATPEEII